MSGCIYETMLCLFIERTIVFEQFLTFVFFTLFTGARSARVHEIINIFDMNIFA